MSVNDTHSTTVKEPVWGTEESAVQLIARNVSTRYLAYLIDGALGLVMLPFNLEHLGKPLYGVWILVVSVTATFSLLGFIIGIWAEGFEKLQIVPLLIVTPLTFLGGTFYSTSVLPPVWQTISLFNPVVYLISGFRWSFFEIADVSHGLSVGMTLVFLAACLTTVWWIFKTGYKLKK